MKKQPSKQEPSGASTTRSSGCFRYPWWKIMALNLFLVLAIGCASAVAYTADISHSPELAILAVVFFVPMFPIYALFIGAMLTICIDENAISSAIFGWKWQRIDWQNVKEIRTFPSFKLYASGRAPFSFVISIVQSPRNKFPLQKNGPIVFTSEIQASRTLLDSINCYIIRYKVPIQSYVSESGDIIKEPRRIEKL